MLKMLTTFLLCTNAAPLRSMGIFFCCTFYKAFGDFAWARKNRDFERLFSGKGFLFFFPRKGLPIYPPFPFRSDSFHLLSFHPSISCRVVGNRLVGLPRQLEHDLGSGADREATTGSVLGRWIGGDARLHLSTSACTSSLVGPERKGGTEEREWWARESMRNVLVQSCSLLFFLFWSSLSLSESWEWEKRRGTAGWGWR